MKEPSFSHRRSLISSKKLKLVCSFNGAFQRRSPSGKLRYVGGETRIISVDRGIGFLRLRSTISALCPKTPSFSLKYLLPDSDDTPLVLIASDDDVRCMVDEFDKLDAYGKPPRLWVFVCNDSDASFSGNSEVPLKRDRTESLSENAGILCGRNGAGSVSFVKGASGLGEILRGTGCKLQNNSCGFQLSAREGKKLVAGGPVARHGDGFSLRKMVLKQQLLAKQSERFNGSNGSLLLGNHANDMEFTCGGENQKHEHPIIDVDSDPQLSVPYDTANRSLEDPGRDKLPDFYKFRHTCIQGIQNLVYVGQLPVSHSYPLNPRDANLFVGSDSSAHSFSGWSTCQVLNGVQVIDGSSGGKACNKNVISMSAHCNAKNDLRNAKHTLLNNDLRKSPPENPHVMTIKGRSSNCAIKKESLGMDPWDIVSILEYSNDSASSQETEVECNNKLLDMEADFTLVSDCHDEAYTSSSDGASSANISLHHQSLSSSKEVEPKALCPLANSSASETSLETQPNPKDLTDEGRFSSGPQLTCFQTAARLRIDHDDEEKQQDRSSSLSINRKASNNESQRCSKLIEGIPSDLAAIYTHLATRELQTISNSDLEYIKELGSGTYGTVYYGKWKGSGVAIKRMKPSCFTEDAVGDDRLVADFWKEANMLGQLHHPNIVALYGVVRDGPVKNLATVTEYMVNGSLKQVLQRKDRTIDRRKRIIVAMDAAFGMEYLHEKDIVHFDLKSHNFLVNMKDPHRPVCKIGDLGLSKIKQKTLVSCGVRGTLPWMAPELLNCKSNMVSEKVDVYSFGIVMWELLSGEEPYANMRSEEIIAGIIKGNMRPEVPSWCDPAWKSLMERCWSSDPESRPAFSKISSELRAMSAAMKIK